jgi:hypothetical protein
MGYLLNLSMVVRLQLLGHPRNSGDAFEGLSFLFSMGRLLHLENILTTILVTHWEHELGFTLLLKLSRVVYHTLPHHALA